MINWDNVNKAIKNIIELAVPIFISGELSNQVQSY